MSASSVDGAVLVLGQHGRVVDRVLLAGEGVVVGAHLVELAVHVVGRAASGVPLNIMCSRKWLTPAIASVSSREPVLTKNAQGGRIGLGVALGDHLQAVVAACAYETPTGTSSGAGAERDDGEIAAADARPDRR